MTKNKTGKRGFSLVETVISMTIIVMVSFCALGVIISEATMTAKQSSKFRAMNEVRNISACLRAYDTAAALNLYSDGKAAVIGNTVTVYYDTDFTPQAYDPANPDSPQNAVCAYRLTVVYSGVSVTQAELISVPELSVVYSYNMPNGEPEGEAAA